MLQSAAIACIDGVQLDRFVPGFNYDVSHLIGAYLIAEGWAEPADPPPSTVPAEPLQSADDALPPNLEREFFPPYFDGPSMLGTERRRRPGRRGR